MKAPRLLVSLLVTAGACSSADTPRPAPTPSQARAQIAQGSGSNVAATADTSTDPRLKPRFRAGPPAAVRPTIERAVTELARWRVHAADDSVISATRTTRVFRWVDDIVIVLTPVGDSTRIDARSASRVGKGDLGQNRRNLAELWASF